MDLDAQEAAALEAFSLKWQWVRLDAGILPKGTDQYRELPRVVPRACVDYFGDAGKVNSAMETDALTSGIRLRITSRKLPQYSLQVTLFTDQPAAWWSETEHTTNIKMYIHGDRHGRFEYEVEKSILELLAQHRHHPRQWSRQQILDLVHSITLCDKSAVK